MKSEEPEVALPTSWKTKPLPSQVARLPFQKSYTAAEFAVLARGLVPKEMEDKWFVYLQEGVLYLHRSWTGICIYRVAFQEKEGCCVVREALANRDPEQYKSANDGYDSALLNFLVDSLLLGKPSPFPLP